MKRKKYRRWILKFLSVVAFVAVSSLALFFAYGYRYDPFHQDVQKISIVDLVYENFISADVFLDGKSYAEALPSQIKEVLPGKHFLSISRKGFQPWNRIIHVKADIVTKIDDIFLFPEYPEKHTKTVGTFLKEGPFYYNHQYLAFIRPDHHFFTLFTFYGNDGKLSQSDFFLKKSDIKNIQMISSSGLLITFEDLNFALFDFQRQSFLYFALPFDVQGLFPDFRRQKLYIHLNNNLYVFPFDQLDTIESEDFLRYLFLEDVEKFTLAENRVFFIKHGLVFSSDLNSSNIVLQSKIILPYTDLAFKEGKNNNYIILRSDKKRLLYRIAIDGSLILVSTSLKGQPLLDKPGQIVYLENDGSLLLQKDLGKPILLRKFSPDDDIVLIGWFYDQKQLLFQMNQDFYVSDLSFSNIYSLELQDFPLQVFPTGKSFFYLNENTLKQLDLEI